VRECLHRRELHALGLVCDGLLTQGPEGRPQLLREQLGLFPGGEVPAPVGLVEVDEVGVDPLGQPRGAWKISPGNTVKATGSETSGGSWPAAAAALRAPSQYIRAAEVAVFVGQYSVRLSTILSRVRPPAGCPSTKARETFS
jgi:hypothetical protein